MRSVFAYLLAGIFVLAVAGAAVLYAERMSEQQALVANEAFEQALTEALDEGLRDYDRRLDDLYAAFELIDDLKTSQELRLRRFRNADHLTQARARGIRVSGMEEAERLRQEGALVRLEDTEHYYLQDFDYSIAYVVPAASRLLDTIGERLHAELLQRGLPPFRFNISSVLRTAENQRALRGINPNATLGVSAHEYGTTLDIVFHVYDYEARPDEEIEPTEHDFLNSRLEAMRARAVDAVGMRYWRMLRGLLGRVLIDLQDEGKVLVTLERQQPVFHITVADDLTE